MVSSLLFEQVQGWCPNDPATGTTAVELNFLEGSLETVCDSMVTFRDAVMFCDFMVSLILLNDRPLSYNASLCK